MIAQEEEDGADAESSDAVEKRVRLDLEVEASGFGRALQLELENVGDDQLVGFNADTELRST